MFCNLALPTWVLKEHMDTLDYGNYPKYLCLKRNQDDSNLKTSGTGGGLLYRCPLHGSINHTIGNCEVLLNENPKKKIPKLS